MKNGIAMISKRSMLVKSFSPERDRDRHARGHQCQQQREQQLGAHRVRQLDDV
jgi:hypothetical protein